MAKILIIDDDEATLFLLSELARCSGHHVDHVTSVKDALPKIQKINYALIFLDYLMPEYNGKDFLKLYLNMFPDRNTPIIIISSDESQTTLKTIMDNGARGFLSKPVNKFELLRLIEVYCEE
ncbi:MAG: hypothetical protein A2202_00335 [Bdellovibrionales bacterium RIFOXYA1_FULL_36_14]|nr:MAG: hypothetical protein A2202_00335 [Bdellovibrionales bacterium RIFOXYA1_FULL_36_14]